MALDALESKTFLEDAQPVWLCIQDQSEEKHNEKHHMLDSEDRQNVRRRVFFEALEPRKDVVNLVTGVTTEDNVCKDAHHSEDIQCDFPSADIVSFLRKRTSSSAFILEHVRLSLEVYEDASDSRAKREGCSKEGDVSERHDHLKIIVELFNFVLFKLS